MAQQKTRELATRVARRSDDRDLHRHGRILCDCPHIYATRRRRRRHEPARSNSASTSPATIPTSAAMVSARAAGRAKHGTRDAVSGQSGNWIVLSPIQAKKALNTKSAGHAPRKERSAL